MRTSFRPKTGPLIQVYTDGSFLPQQDRAGGYAAIVLFPNGRTDMEVVVGYLKADPSQHIEYLAIAQAVETGSENVQQARRI